ncbi:hypothetical protein [Lentzea pudingi]|uniref:hypothetical protein n=1 Tax=Lentzea pudingi TaxID=1789439 RepID=UPI0027E45787|nr:hypothetical protein [Lentzea pudingi]
MRVVITGASGNVGTGVLRALAADTEDHEVLGICRRPPPSVWRVNDSAPPARPRWR